MIKQFFEFLWNPNNLRFLLASNLFISAFLYYSMYTLPNRISEAIKPIDRRDSVKASPIKPIYPPLPTKEDFVYLDAYVNDSSISLSTYTYLPSYPEEIWKGYVTEVVTKIDDTKYYIWSPEKIIPIIDKEESIEGYFFATGITAGDNGVPILIPAIKKTW